MSLIKIKKVKINYISEEKMKLFQTSGPAIFMYSIIALGVIISIICFTIFYGGYIESQVILWIGITAFTITYHFGLELF